MTNNPLYEYTLGNTPQQLKTFIGDEYMRIIKRIKCFKDGHKTVPYGEYYTTNSEGHKVLKHIWKCSNCGCIKYGK